jgi:hypothetical protein
MPGALLRVAIRIAADMQTHFGHTHDRSDPERPCQPSIPRYADKISSDAYVPTDRPTGRTRRFVIVAPLSTIVRIPQARS